YHAEKFSAIRAAYDRLRDLKTRVRYRLFEAGGKENNEKIIEDLESQSPRRRGSPKALLGLPGKRGTARRGPRGPRPGKGRRGGRWPCPRLRRKKSSRSCTPSWNGRSKSSGGGSRPAWKAAASRPRPRRRRRST